MEFICVTLMIIIGITDSTADQFVVVGPVDPLFIVSGEDVILPCSLKPNISAVNMRVEWFRLDLKDSVVHLYEDHEDKNTNQLQSYRGRTEVFKDELQKGNTSLKLSRVQISDEGLYKCLIQSKTNYDDITVDLNVEVVGSPPLITVDGFDVSGGLHLQCESKGWYPEPELVWLDSEGVTLTSENTDKQRETDGFIVKHMITVYNRDSKYHCRVRLRHHMMETEIITSSKMFNSLRSSVILISVGSVLGVIAGLLIAVFIYIYREQQVKDQRLKSEDQRLKSEDQRLKSEDQRLKSEDQRLKSEDQRLKSEDQRLKSEDQRLKSEEERLQSEDQRLKSEEERLQGEDQRLKSEEERLQSEDQRLKNVYNVNSLEFQTLSLREKRTVGSVKSLLRKYAVNVTLDPDSAHPDLIVSDDGKQVRYEQQSRTVKDGDQKSNNKFDKRVCVLGNEGFTSGCFYYEVEVKGLSDWFVGVARESVERKGWILLNPESGYWVAGLRYGEYQASEGPSVSLSLSVAPQRVRVFVDYEEGRVSFYDVESMCHIYCFINQSFKEKLHPIFWHNNFAPLIICDL
ncbi:butyrophilin subfamily 2 member A1 [Misgurnus anguillicaudatus]|uniref:butyrophilin subfamily 2 member A1 n=1 Tax=Misgurnus anguillicaudatus TaxID=75329 RepID=UPI003CCF4312